MTTFKMVDIQAYTGGLIITSPHTEVLEVILAQVKSIKPDCNVTQLHANSWRIHKLSGDDEEIGFQIMAYLGDNGWEVVAAYMYENFPASYVFRKAFKP